MHEVLIASIVGIAGVFLAMTILIVANKAWRETAQFYRSGRRRVLEPLVLSYAQSDERSLLAVLGDEFRARDALVLEEILLDYSQRVRGGQHDQLVRALDELGYVDNYLEALASRRWWRRAWAAEQLGLAGAKRAVRALIRAMRDEVSDVRMRAAKALGILGGTVSTRQLIRALNEPNRWSSIRIADVLTAMGRDVVAELIETFESLTPSGKLAALDVIGRVRPLTAVPWLQLRLDDAEPDVRARAAHALGAIGDPHSVPQLRDALTDEAWPVRAMAAKALGRIGEEHAIPDLCRAMADHEWWVRSNAAQAVRAMGRAGVEALERMLDSRDRYATHQAVLMLQELGIVDARVNELTAESVDARTRAMEFVRRLVEVGQFSRLRALAKEPRHAPQREALLALLPELPEPQPEPGR